MAKIFEEIQRLHTEALYEDLKIVVGITFKYLVTVSLNRLPNIEKNLSQFGL